MELRPPPDWLCAIVLLALTGAGLVAFFSVPFH
jgi:hypothetical protein